MRRFLTLSLILATIACVHGAEIGLSELDLTRATQGWNKPQADRTVQGQPLVIAKKTYAKGFGTHAVSELWLALDGRVDGFTAEVGLDDEQNGSGSVEFAVVGDGKLLWRSEVMGSGEKAKRVDVRLAGVKTLLLYVSDGGDGTGNDHADWADATFSYSGGKPTTIAKPADGRIPELPLVSNVRGYMRKVPAGYSATIFAKPPEISYPVQVCAAPGGEVFIAIDKNGSLDRKPHFGSIVRATDTNGDGEADRFDTFVADVDSPRGLAWDGRTLYCLHPPTITAYRDTDGDGKADWHEDIVTGVGYGLDKHPADHTSNGIRMGIDGWLYMAIGDFGIPDGKGRDGSSVVMRGGGVLRVRPDGSELEVFITHTRNIFDVALDPFLNTFLRDNTNDGDGWNSRLSYAVASADMGYPSLYKRFSDELVAPLADYGGGSAVGSLFVHEPGLPGEDGDALLTCDWGTSCIYRHPLKPAGPGWSAEQSEWARIERVTDIDVDGSGRFYAASWRGAVFTYAGEKVGAILRIAPDGATPPGFPDLAKAGDADLVKVHLASRSAVCRQHAQNEILRRGPKPAFATGLTTLAKSAATPLDVRVAAMFTFKQMAGAAANDALVALAKDAAVQEWALRALADRKTQLANVSAEPFLEGLKSANPRVQVQALIGLARLGKPETAAAVVPLTAVSRDDKGPARLIPHIAVRTLQTLKNVEPLLAMISPGSSPEQLNGALWALSYLPQQNTADGLIAKLGGATPELRQRLLTTLVRLYNKEGEWNRTAWWGTRPEFLGPYFQRTAWEGTPAIEAALKAAYAKGGEEAAFIAQQVEYHKLRIDGIGAGEVAKGPASQADAELLAKAQAATRQGAGAGGKIGTLGFEEVMAGALAAKGDAKKGEQMFLTQGCAACHTVSKDLPQKGPYLGEVAKQYNRSELIESIVKPNARIAQGFATHWFDLKDGQRQIGFITSEGAETIQLRNIVGQAMELKVADIVKRGEDKKSMMPEGLVANLKPEELSNLLAYFESLVGK
jgi:putative membrane-bound dehydrogenase-like protein